MPKYRLTDETKEQIISALKQTKSEIEQRIQKLNEKSVCIFSFLPL